MLYFHGTNYDAGLDIIKNGFNPQNKLWTCSQKDMIYLVSEECDACEIEEETEMIRTPAFDFAVRAGQIAAAHNNQLTDKIIVFAFDIPDDEILCPDISSPNMDDCYQIESSHLNQWIADGYVKMTAYSLSSAYEPSFRVFYLSGLDEQYYTPPKNLEKALRSLLQVEAYWFYEDYCGQFDDYEVIYESNSEKQVFTY